MILPDVNALIYAFRPDSKFHGIYRPWLESVLNDDVPYAMAPDVLAAVMRLATSHKAFVQPDTLADVSEFIRVLLEQPHCRIVRPGPRHWKLFCDLCQKSEATGNLIPDAWFAALAIENNCEWISEDQDFKKFPGLRWRALSLTS